MRLWLKYSSFPLFNAPEAGGGGPAVAPAPAVEQVPAAPAAPEPGGPEGAEPADSGFEKILEAFERDDEPDEGPEPSAPAAPAPVEPTPAPPPTQTPPAPAVPTPAAAPAAQVGVQTAAQAPAPAPTPAAPAVAQAPAAPTVAPAPSTEGPPGPAAPGTQGYSFEQIAEGLKKQRGEFVEALAKTNYAVSEQDLEEFASNPGKVISRVAAQVQVETTASLSRVLSEQLPVVVNGLIEANRRNQEAEEAFWSANKHLDRSKHRAEALQTYQQLRTLQPNMSREDGIRQVGQWMALKHGIPYLPQGVPQNPGSNPQAPAAPQQVVHTPGPVVRTAVPGGFVPAGPSAAPASSMPQPPKSPFDQFFDTFVLDEKGAFEE